MDRCTWINQICEIWGLLSFWRGENLFKSNWLSCLSRLDINASFLQQPSFQQAPASIPLALLFFWSFSCAEALIRIHYRKKRAVMIQPRQKCQTHIRFVCCFVLICLLLWSAGSCLFVAVTGPVLCWPGSLFIYPSPSPLSVQMDSHRWWLHPAVGEV